MIRLANFPAARFISARALQTDPCRLEMPHHLVTFQTADELSHFVDEHLCLPGRADLKVLRAPSVASTRTIGRPLRGPDGAH